MVVVLISDFMSVIYYIYICSRHIILQVVVLHLGDVSRYLFQTADARDGGSFAGDGSFDLGFLFGWMVCLILTTLQYIC